MWSAILLTTLLAPPSASPRGKLLIVGGGDIDSQLRRDLVKRGGTRMVLVPFASDGAPEPGVAERIWRDAGAQDVAWISAADVALAKKRLASADFIWMPGGKQSILARRLNELGLADVIRQRFRDGATIGGTSAGASIVSRHMIRGVQGKTELLDGLGLWPEVVVDQHFLKRNRQGRLSQVILQRPELLGVGIDEATAIEVKGSCFEVFGTSQVVVIDARQKVKSPATLFLKAGKRFDLVRGLLGD